MFVIKFQGALGNQMFEYAFFKAMENRYPDNTIKAYIPEIEDFNGYELKDVFGIEMPRATWKDVVQLSNDIPKEVPFYIFWNFLRKIQNVKNGNKYSSIKQDDNTVFYSEVFELSTLHSYFLDGVWANAQYFDDLINLRSDLLLAFTFKSPLTGDNKTLSEEMERCESVSVHVRRNEYVSMGLTVTSDDYYKNAIKLIKEKIQNPKFYIFSDDHDYCKNLFDGLIDYKLITGNTKKNSYKDMQLMTYCKHNIIANSTFSFWGAYLSNKVDKIVIAPNVSWGNLKHTYACKNWIIMNAK